MDIEPGLHVLCAGETCQAPWLAEALYTQGMACSHSSASLQPLERGDVHSTLSGEAPVAGQRSQDRRTPQKVARQSHTLLEQICRTLWVMPDFEVVVGGAGHSSVSERLPLPVVKGSYYNIVR